MASASDYPVEECLPSYEYRFQKDVLNGKVALITGGGSGICFTIAEVFMRHGCRTAIAGRKIERVKVSAQTLTRTTGQQCLPLHMDVRNPKEVMAGVEKCMQEFGRIDILINGAAGNFLCPLENLTYNGFKTVQEIDTQGTFNASKAVFDSWMKNHGGVILNITSVLQHRGTPLQAHAGAAKAGIEALTKHQAVEWGVHGIRTLCVAPGAVQDTEGLRKLGRGYSMDQIASYTPLRKIASRVDIANICLFGVLDIAWLITGTTIVADGAEGMGGADVIHRIEEFKKLKARM